MADALQHPRRLGVLQAGAGGLEPAEEKEQQPSRLDEPVKRYHLTEAHLVVETLGTLFLGYTAAARVLATLQQCSLLTLHRFFRFKLAV